MDYTYLVPFIIMATGTIILVIRAIYLSSPRFILRSKQLKVKIEQAETRLQFRDLCRELASLRQEIPDKNSQIMADFIQVLKELGKKMDIVMLPEIMRAKTLTELNFFIKWHECLYKEMGVFMPYGKFGRFSQYRIFPEWFLQERMKRLDIIESISNKMTDPFKILQLLQIETPTSPEAAFPYFFNDDDEPIPMEIRKRVGGLLVETARTADTKEIFINIFWYAGILTDADAIQESFIAYIKKEKISGVFWEWKSYIDGIISALDKLNSPVDLLSTREYYNKLYEFLDQEKNSALVESN